MSVSWLATLEVFRELRWLFSTSSSTLSWPAIALLVIVVGSSCFLCGAIFTCVVLSARCRLWIWHCLSGAHRVWSEPPVYSGRLDLRERFREYRA